MLNEQTLTILALRPARREMGIAALKGDELVEWGIMGFRDRVSECLLCQVERRLTAQFLRHQPTILAIEQPTNKRLQASPLLAVITDRIRRMVEAADMPLRWYKPEIIRQRLCGSRQKTRRHLAEQVVSRYQHLKLYWEAGNAGQESYWTPMFAAIATALVCAHDSFASPPIPRGAECATSVDLPYQEAGYCPHRR